MRMWARTRPWASAGGCVLTGGAAGAWPQAQGREGRRGREFTFCLYYFNHLWIFAIPMADLWLTSGYYDILFLARLSARTL